MNSTTDASGHPDVEEISDLTEGLLPPGRSTEIQRHVETCAVCADTRASLEEIRELLGSASAAEPMPDAVATRIDAALAAEALLGRAGDDTADHVSRETSAATDHPAGRPPAATGPGRGKNGRIKRRRVVLGTVLTAAVLGAGSLALLQSFGDHTSDTTAHGKPTPSARPFSGNSVQSQVKNLLGTKESPRSGTGSARPRGEVGTEQASPGGTERPRTLVQPEAAVPDCVRQALRQGDTVLGAKTGTYDGKTAYLVVVPDARDISLVTAYVVDAACMGRQPASAGEVLLTETFPRP
ncbi:hypothetical protein NX794_10825 [Streptomyces sp. LP11]|uniref:Zinc-finger domain-containing protein n=1 Tax=Streptomyces pyxinicus TaxID=2970331 RepID=A0ABT2AZM9_9ACTN|nr:hypothetical protein [Streptomyces sp. LP11]MCS0601705.1 hypothetical protein [Streptomyces sp. LP11]